MAAVANFFDCLKICPGDHGNHGELRLLTPFPYVVLRSPRFVHGGRKRDCRGRRGHSVNVALKIDSPIFVQNINMLSRELFLLFKKSTTFWDNPRR